MTPDEPRPTSGGAVFGGVVVGLIGAVIYMVIGFVATFAMSYESSFLDWIWLPVLAAPAIIGALLLAFERTRRAGAGFVMGLAIGMIIVPATCLTPFLGA